MTSPAFSGRTAARGVRWSLGAVVAKQGFQLLCALVVARILGPEGYGTIGAATVYLMFMVLLLDQGLSAALIQRPELTARTAGATATLNLLVSVLLVAATIVLAPQLAAFFGAPPLEPVLQWLAVLLPLKALAITPRALLARNLHFRGIGAADIAAAAAGACAGIAAALLGAGAFSLVVQVAATDLLTAVVLLAAARPPLPNRHLSEVRPLLAFGASVLATNGLAYFSRNTDNILVGRVFGVSALSLYAMAYRILVVPVQLVGQTVNRVMFPAIARSAADLPAVARQVATTTRLLAMLAIPPMAAVACAAPELVETVLGPAWLPAAPLMSVLAIGGARETLFYITPALMKGLGRAGLNLRYELLAFAVQVGGIAIGACFGLIWVAVGIVVAGFALTPVLLVLQHRLCGVRIGAQLAGMWPALHASLWASGAYLLLREFLTGGWAPPARLAVGAAAYLAVLAAVLVLAHRRPLREFLRSVRSLAGAPAPPERSGREPATEAAPAPTPLPDHGGTRHG